MAATSCLRVPVRRQTSMLAPVGTKISAATAAVVAAVAGMPVRAGMGATVAAFSSSPPPPPLMAAKGSDSGGNQSEQTVGSEGRVGAVDRMAIMEAALVEVVRVNTAIFVSNPSNRHSYRTMVLEYSIYEYHTMFASRNLCSTSLKINILHINKTYILKLSFQIFFLSSLVLFMIRPPGPVETSRSQQLGSKEASTDRSSSRRWKNMELLGGSAI